VGSGTDAGKAAVNHYQALGVTVSASSTEIRRAYVQLARQYHPDMHARAGPVSLALAEQRMCELNLAWETLGEPSRRADYDRALGLHLTGGRSGDTLTHR
jgi:DnaJ-class molecular chaperone